MPTKNIGSWRDKKPSLAIKRDVELLELLDETIRALQI
ncbi:hypothetical protein EV13_0962 [Prochlorococcus sp. MIT 0702]|nr:hypothetical protein EV12_0416 [Prochlorococcus sp. MIT 0701]KGG29744.1 hypothetical protein EV13_0962 [Prochlorococcus sp. MIT 0702]KGG34300.1 hypothetical protein EV14_1394 [Prochlorococcus sp. MIT 0703]